MRALRSCRGFVRAYECNALVKIAAQPVLAVAPDTRDEQALQMQAGILELLKAQDRALARTIAPGATSLVEYLVANRAYRIANNGGRDYVESDEVEKRERARAARRQERLLFVMRTAKATANAKARTPKPRNPTPTHEQRLEYWRERRRAGIQKRRAAKEEAEAAAMERATELLSRVCAECEVLECHCLLDTSRPSRAITLARRVFAMLARDTDYCGELGYKEIGSVAGDRGFWAVRKWHVEGREDAGAVLVASAMCGLLGIAAPAYAVAAKEGSAG